MSDTIFDTCNIENLDTSDQTLSVHEYAEIFALQNHILELIAMGSDETVLLHQLCQMEEKLVPGALAGITGRIKM